MLGLAMLLTAGGAVVAPAPVPQQRSGYPKLSRCASPIARPADRPGYSRACLTWRQGELARIAALPLAARMARVAALRARIGLAPDEGLVVAPDGAFRPARMRFARR